MIYKNEKNKNKNKNNIMQEVVARRCSTKKLSFLFYFDICIKHTLLAMILTMEKSHLMFELY